MGKKVIAIALAIFFSRAFTCFASDSAVKEIAVGDSLHKISFERLDKDPPLFVAMDRVDAPVKDIARFSLSATLSENRVLKSLIVIVASGQAFAASGELEWHFPSGEQLNMYGKTTTKLNKDGTTEYSIAFLTGLSDLFACSTATTDGNVLLKLYSKKGAAKEFEIPSAFFTFLSKTTE